MKVSRKWLQTFFDVPLPATEVIVDALTFHSSEIEEVIERDGDTVLDVKVLPDKSAWMLSHRGVAKELATILEIPLMNDPLRTAPDLTEKAASLSVELNTEKCNRYSAAVVRGVTVGPSPSWLVDFLEAIGQRSINNVVDATNYVMFHTGQPVHAFDAGKLDIEDGAYRIGVRMAREGERITTLTGDEYELTENDMVIVDRCTDMPIGLGGVKGGARAAVDAGTTDLVIECGNFDRITIRKTSARHRLRTDASARYENGVVPELAAYGLAETVRLIVEIAGGTSEGFVDVFPKPQTRAPVTVSLAKLNSALGLTLSVDDVEAVLARFGYAHEWTGEAVTVIPPFERDDLVIAEDLVEEIGRIYGLAHVPSETPDPLPLTEFNTLFYYADQVRQALTELGFSEVFTSSFRNKDTVKLANALASDKGYLRSNLRENLSDALTRNIPHRDLLGLSRIAIFEIGTVFGAKGEHVSIALGVRSGTAYKPKQDDPVIAAAIEAIAGVVGNERFTIKDGIAEADFTEAIADLPEPTGYAPFVRGTDTVYQPFSPYPSISRDIALWVSGGTEASDVERVLNEHAGPLRVRTTCFDEFTKDGRTSYAFRLVFQSSERTLTDEEVNACMDTVYRHARESGWEVR